MSNSQELSYDVLVIGGGPAGVTAALRASELGARVALVEQGRLGGTCTNDGCVPTRVMAKAARLLREARHFDTYGLIAPPPELDFARLMLRTQQVVYQIHQKKQLIAHLEEAGVEVMAQSGVAKFIDPHVVERGDGGHIQAEKIILCVGGRARRIDFPGAHLAVTHSEIWELRSLPRRILIIGGAATGCQLASIFEAFGSRVTLLEVMNRIMTLEDPEVSQTIEGYYRERGIVIHTGIQKVDWIDENDDGLLVQYVSREGVQQHGCDVVVLSTGWVGNLASLNLPAANVETIGNYVRVDDHLRTSAAHIYAAGDITGRMMLVQSAGVEAMIAAENAVSNVNRDQRHTIVPHGGFTDPEYGSVGLTEDQARQRGEIAMAVVRYHDLDRAVIDGHAEGMCKLIALKANGEILGVHVVGEQALEVVEIAAAGMAAGMHVSQLAELEIAYPTFTAIVGLAARQICHDLGFDVPSARWGALSSRLPAGWELSHDH